MKFLLIFLFINVELSAYIIGIAGGSASGKSTLANDLKSVLGNRAVLVHQDDYYKKIEEIPLNEFGKPNFACPGAIDAPLLKQHLTALAQGKAAHSPVYNFTLNKSETFTRLIEPAEIVIVEGFLILALPEIRDLLDFKIYVDTDGDIRLLRRIERDVQERGRSFDSIKQQYMEEVKPMHDQYVEPSKQHADMILTNSKGLLNLFLLFTKS